MLAGMTFWELVQVAGYFAEAVGIGLAAWEILDRGRQLAAFETSQRAINLYPEAAVASARAGGATLTLTPATPPTMEKRVDDLEHHLEQDLPRQFEAIEKAAAKTAEEQTRRIIRPMQASFQSDLDKLSETLRGSLSGHRRALGSVALLLIGLALQGVGSIEGAHDATRAGETTATSGCTLLIAPGCRLLA